ncbi:class I SAM-dependent DNA methyltransferase [Xenorhabdus khoisanae]|uniref:type I restriction-modification system subunit M n=1 Tax=Xenorhabdus khoisanae TaxID=880157 RepID=UPI0032B7B399
MAKAATKKTKTKKGFEETLWDTANQLRGSVESSEYKHVVLSLVFLKFISDKFEQRRKKMEDEGQQTFIDMEIFYQQDNIFYLPEEARWSFIQERAKQDDIAVLIDTALSTIEKRNPALKGALPDNYFSRQNLEPKKLASLIDSINNIETTARETGVKELSKEDLIGRVYEYFLGKFAATEGKGGGEFYTPKCVVTLLTEMLEPFQGKIYDPCCGSGGMFVQSVKFVESHQGKSRDIAIYGQELTATTYKLAKMNLAIRGLSGNLGEKPADTFFNDQHPDLKADYILSNPPFNLKGWRDEKELTDDRRFAGYRTPPTGSANYGWILHILSKLSSTGTAGFVLANGSMSSNTSGEGEIRAQMIENDLVECMIALPGQLFYTTQIPACLWFITKNKDVDVAKGYRNRQGETLFIDARNLGSMVNRTSKELTADDIATIADTYHAWRSTPKELAERIKRGDGKLEKYEDIAGFCKVATIEEIKANDYVLTPGRYVGAAEHEDDGIAFETKMRDLSKTLFQQMKQAEELDKVIRQNLEVLGYGE